MRAQVRLTIVVKLLVAFTAPTAVLFAVFAAVAHEVMRRDLEAELGTRLTAVASAAATQLRGGLVAELAPGDEEHLLYASTRRKLEDIAQATGVARLYLFDRGFASRVDSGPDVPIGTEYHQAKLDRDEIARMFEAGQAVSSVLFEGQDGRQYKAGYAPIYHSDRDRRIVLAIGADAPATFFDRLADLRRKLVLYGIGSILAMTGIAILVAALITRPVRSLAAAAARIGRGELDAPIQATSRDEIGFLAQTMDQMRVDLGARDARMQEMLSGIAHEVRNPLGGIELFAGILRDELPPDDERRPHVERIEREVGYLKAVVAEFLDYARRPAPELKPVVLPDLFEEVASLEEADAARGEVELRCAAPAGLDCLGDPVQLRRAIHNLVRNALQAAQAAPAPRRVTLSAEEQDGEVAVRIHNTGAAIPKQVEERLFEPFFTTREKGTGLGLAFVREIALDHGGAIEVDSGDERGTTFTLRLPRRA